MAKRPQQGIDSLGSSLLSQQSTRRDKENKKRRKASKRMMLMGALVAGQSVVNSALKRRTQEIQATGELSKLRSKTQSQNFNSMTPIFQSIDSYDTYEDWVEDIKVNPMAYNKLKNKLSPVAQQIGKTLIGDVSPEEWQQQYSLVDSDLTHHLAKKAFDHKASFNKGAEDMAKNQGIDIQDRNAMWSWFSDMDVNSLDGIKARKMDKILKNKTGTIFDGGVFRSLGNAMTFGLVQDDKGSSNPFTKLDINEELISKDITQVFDKFNVNKLVTERIQETYATLRDESKIAANNKDGVAEMTAVFANTNTRLTRGTFWEFWGDEGGHRLSEFKEGRIDDLLADINEQPNIKNKIVTSAMAVSNMIGDARKPKIKEMFMEKWLDLPHINELGIKKGDKEYLKVLSSLNDQVARDEFAFDFTVSMVAQEGLGVFGGAGRSGQFFGRNNFEYNFDQIDSLIKPSFEVKDNKFVTTLNYKSADPEDQKRLYTTYVKAILTNQTQSKLNSRELLELGRKFVLDVPSPTGDSFEDILERLSLDS